MLSSFILLILFFVDAKDFYSKNNLIKETQDEPAISREYFLGEYLIYDCEKGSFLCVNDSGFQLCKGRRESDRYLKKISYRCAPLKKYQNQKECIDAQLQFINNPKQKSFCE